MTERVDMKALLNKLNEEKGILNEDGDGGSMEFDCQYNLLCGLKIKIPTTERKKLNEWKEMAKSVENSLEKRKNERNKNLLEEIRKVELRMEKNRLKKMSGERPSVGSNKTNMTLEENEKLPFVYQFNKNAQHTKTELNGDNHLGVDKKYDYNCSADSQLMSEQLNGIECMPGLKKHMESLHSLQSRQKELDEWYGSMQKQLAIEKIRLEEKYEELHLKNIREQQSVIESSQEFLRCASNNNNTPSVANANSKQIILNDFDKNKRAPGSFKCSKTSMTVNNSPPVIHSSSLPTFKTTPSKLKSVESDCLTSDKISVEYATPCASPNKNMNKTIENAFEMNGVKDYYSISTVSAETSSEIVIDESIPDTKKDVVEDTVKEVVNVDLQDTVNVNSTYVKDKSKNTSNCSYSLASGRNIDDNIRLMQSKSLPMTLKNKGNAISEGDCNSVDSNDLNNVNVKESGYSIHYRSTTPNERKTVISVPSRQMSSEIVDSLEFGRGSFEQLMKDHDFHNLESRRKSRPVKFFNDPFPSEVISHGSFDNEICTSANTCQTISRSPISTSISHSQMEPMAEQQQTDILKNQADTFQVQTSGKSDIVSDNCNADRLQRQTTRTVISSPGKLDSSSNSPHSVSPRQDRLQRQITRTINPNTVNSSFTAHQYNNTKLNGSVVNLSSMVGSISDHHITSTPEKFQDKRGVGLLLEISAVKLHEAGEDNDDTSITKNRLRKLNEKLYAVAKGFLTRRLLKTVKVQEIIKTIKDTEEFLDDINKENINNQKLADRQLRVRLQDELSTKRGKLHDIFFNMEPRDQMKMLTISRAQIEERNRKKQAQMKQTRPNTAYSRNLASTNGSGNLSNASQKSIKRRQVNTVPEKVQKNKPVSEKGQNSKKSNIVETTGANIHVCIAGALKPIQSCTSPTMADRKKTKSPMKTNSVQNRYSKKSSVSKRLDMNAAGSINHSSRFKSSSLSTR